MEKFCYIRKDNIEDYCWTEKKMVPLTTKELKSYLSQRVCYKRSEMFEYLDRNLTKARDHCRLTGNF